MQGQSPQIGLYQILNVHRELHNGKPVIAEVIFKAPNWNNFDFTPRKLRLIGLFNKSSTGPKEEFKGTNSSNLKYYFINIITKMEDHEQKKYSIQWEVYKPVNYDDLLQEDMDRTADLHEQGEGVFDIELYTIEMEKQVFDQNLINEIDYENQESNELDEDGNVLI